MSNSNTLEIIQGLAQAAANAWDGSHDGRFTIDEEENKIGLRREEGCPIMDSRVIDGFNVKFYGDMMCISYQSDIKLKEVYSGGFESEMESMINDIKNFLQKEYKSITGKSVSLKEEGEIDILVQNTSRVRTWVQAKRHFKIGALKMDPIKAPSEKKEDNVIKEWIARAKGIVK
tara:strand:- start:261 stop:782 length:522 start_codon:yes stop_codon:yes gene_type:complete